MGRGYVCSQGAGGRIAYPANTVCTALRTGWDFSQTIKFDKRCQVAGIVDGRAVGQVVLQGKFIGGGINLAKIVDASTGRAVRT